MRRLCHPLSSPAGRIVDVDAGRNVTVVEPCNLYGCRLGDDVFVGPFVEIQRHVSIGARSKIQSHSFICEYVTLGKRVLSATASPSPTICSKTARPMPIRPAGAHHGDRVSIGSGATITAVEICSDAVIGARAVVTRDITRKDLRRQPGASATGAAVMNPAIRIAAIETLPDDYLRGDFQLHHRLLCPAAVRQPGGQLAARPVAPFRYPGAVRQRGTA